MKIVECVPNFSEGRNKEVIEAISSAIKKVNSVQLLDVDPGAATNRTVFTFAGPPEAVLEAAFFAIKTGTELIDMRNHKGAHARMGACDVCPFVPVSGVSMSECVELSKKLARRVGEELGIPVYLYAQAAVRPDRVRLPDIREGEYEGLAKKMEDENFAPDFGPAKFNAKSGATAIGARKFLIAYNVNLNTLSVKLAKDIAFAIRESGRTKKDSSGQTVCDENGVPQKIPGRFQATQATGWFIPEYERAQVTINILDMDKAPLHAVFDACCEEAARLGLRVTGSEIVGMIPKKAILDAGVYFLKKQGTAGVPEEDLINAAVLSMGLNDVSAFDPRKKIIEYQFMTEKPLISSTVKDFCAELSRSSPAPGGGSVAALCASLSAALCSMVAALTCGKKGYEGVDAEMKEIGLKSQTLRQRLLDAVDEDTAAFNRLYATFSLPKKTDEDKKKRDEAIEEATKSATDLPFEVMELSAEMVPLISSVVERGNKNSLSDAGVAASLVLSAIRGAYYNVLINTKGYADKKWAADYRKNALSRLNDTQKAVEPLLAEVEKRL